MTPETWHVTHGGGLTFSQNSSCLALTVLDLWYYVEDWEEKDHSVNLLIVKDFVEKARLHKVS